MNDGTITVDALEGIHASETKTPTYFDDYMAGIPPDAHAIRAARGVSLREWITILGMIILADVTLYAGGGGPAGWGGFILAAPLLLTLGIAPRAWGAASIATALMIIMLGLRMLWLGSAPAVILGLLLIGAFSMARAGLAPFVLEFASFIVHACATGCVMGVKSLLSLRPRRIGRDSAAIVAIPFAVLCVFTFIFVMANPILREIAARWRAGIGDWLADFPIGADRVSLWVIVFLAAAGLVRPLVGHRLRALVTAFNERILAAVPVTVPRAARLSILNTLVAVTALFAAYLAFEFYYLWFREFPEGFYYSGYAHQGAAWLTFALVVTTLVLGAIFSGDLARDPSARSLRILALVWSAENFLLALAVFHRTQIYVNYNGMSRMRVVALFGIGTVVAGFTLAVWMVARRKNAVWLFRRQLWALALAVFLLLVAPVDLWVTRHNVRRILAGDLAPSVQIAVHPLDTSGVAALIPLLESGEPAIRDGVAVILAREYTRLRAGGIYETGRHWTHAQWAESRTARLLAENHDAWKSVSDPPKWSAPLSRFDQFARKWYD